MHANFRKINNNYFRKINNNYFRSHHRLLKYFYNENFQIYGINIIIHTMRYLVLSVSRFPETPEDSVGVDVDGHASQEENVTNEKARVIKPAHIVVEVVGEVAALHVAIHQREEKCTKSRNKRSRLPTHTQRKEENPITKIGYNNLHKLYKQII